MSTPLIPSPSTVPVSTSVLSAVKVTFGLKDTAEGMDMTLSVAGICTLQPTVAHDCAPHHRDPDSGAAESAVLRDLGVRRRLAWQAFSFSGRPRCNQTHGRAARDGRSTSPCDLDHRS